MRNLFFILAILGSVMTPSIPQRIKAAFQLMTKGSIAPFDRLIEMGFGAGPAENMKRPYAQSVWVQSAIKHVVDPITSVPIVFSTQRKAGAASVQNPALIEYWERPAVGPEGPVRFCDVIYCTLGWLKLAGESFWIFDDTVLIPFPEARSVFPRFFCARPDRMKQVTTGAGKLIGWRFTDAQGREYRLLPEQVVHLKKWNPYDDVRGLGEWEAAQIAADSDFAAGKFKLNLNQSMGDQGVYVVCKTGILDNAQRTAIIAQLREKRQLQQRGQFHPVFLNGDITIEDPKIRSTDVAFLESRLQDRHEIYIAFGVPPSMADVAASYSIGSASDYYRLICDACMPAASQFCEGVEAVMRMMQMSLFAAFDWSNHRVMREVRREQVDTATKYWDRGISWEVINGVLDLGLPKFDGWDQAYLPFSVTPADEVGMEAQLQDGSPTGLPPSTDPPSPEDTPLKTVAQLFSTRAQSKHSAAWRANMATRAPVEKQYLSKFRAALMEARAEVLAKIDAERTKAATVIRTFSVYIFGLEKFTKTVEQSFEKVSRLGLNKAGTEVFAADKSKDIFAMPEAKIQTFLAERRNKIADASSEVWHGIRLELQNGIDKGETLDDLADRVRGKFNEISKGRARTIALTETSVAFGVARQQAMEQLGYEWKQWVSSQDALVRPTHVAANMDIVAIDDQFLVGGEYLEHPGDPDGSAANVINCRCLCIPIRDKDEA